MADDEVTGDDARRRSTYTPPPAGAEFPERLGELTDDDIARAKKASEAASLAQDSLTPQPSPESATYLPSNPFEAPPAASEANAEPQQEAESVPLTVGDGTPGASPDESQDAGESSAPPLVAELVASEPLIPPAPSRTSLDDQQIMAQFYDGDSPSTETLMSALEAQLDLRAQEDERFEAWAGQIRTLLPAPEAETLIAQSRRRFDGLPPLPEAPPEPAPPAVTQQSSVAEAVEETADEMPISSPAGSPLLAGLVADTEDIPAAREPEPESEAESPGGEAEGESVSSSVTGVFDSVLNDPDASSPPTAAWPLVSPDGAGDVKEHDEAPEEAQVSPETEGQHAEEIDRAVAEAPDESEAAVQAEDVVAPALAESGITVGTETLSIKQAIATKEIPAEPFEAVTVEKERWFSFDRSGVEPSPEMNRTARLLQVFWTWWSVTVPLGGVVVGVWLTQRGASLSEALMSATLGVIVGALPLMVGTLQGVSRGLPTLIVSRQVFGLWGNLVPVAVSVVIRLVVSAFFLWASVWVATQVYVEANLWSGDPAALSVIIALVGVLIVGALTVVGRHWVSLVLWVSGGLSLVAAVLLVVLTWDLPTASALQASGIDGPRLVAGASFVAALMMVLWSQSGSDIARFMAPGRGGPAAATVGVAAIIPPIVLIAWGALLAASGNGVGQALSQTPVGTIVDLAPDWYPIPALILLAFPLLGLSALALHSTSYAVLSLGFAMPRYVAASLGAVLVSGVVFAVLLLTDNPTSSLAGMVFALGVPVAAWVGAILGDAVTRRAVPSSRVLLGREGSYPGIRVAPLLGFVAATGIGWGFIAVDVSGLSWLGYLNDLLVQVGMLDLSSWQLGVAVSLLFSLAVSSFAGIRGGVLDGSEREGA